MIFGSFSKENGAWVDSAVYVEPRVGYSNYLSLHPTQLTYNELYLQRS
jgi:hypothetical protein